ncbi:cell shape-determining protein CcmA [Candidatus Endobugula sertula]|uniref:Cell shape-determining protein CcmA n=1 Tax=Candidatus Endobugula sertula TaxID=62101 RepID=A0A1D2QSY7_9GAMM|nr:cell shape-determining protein CcmA [Candidatus Endobugula sertula]
MFSKKNKKTAFAAGGTTLISKNTEIIGDVHFSGTLMIEGHVKGNVYAVDSEGAQARVLESGCVEGEIRVPTLVINGKVTGDVFSSKHVELASKTSISGNVHYVLIEMVKGAQVNGKLVYTDGSTVVSSKPPKNIDKTSPVLPPKSSNIAPGVVGKA